MSARKQRAEITPLSGRTLAWRSWLRALLVGDDPHLSNLDNERSEDRTTPAGGAVELRPNTTDAA